MLILIGCQAVKEPINTTIPESYEADEEEIVARCRHDCAGRHHEQAHGEAGKWTAPI